MMAVALRRHGSQRIQPSFAIFGTIFSDISGSVFRCSSTIVTKKYSLQGLEHNLTASRPEVCCWFPLSSDKVEPPHATPQKSLVDVLRHLIEGFLDFPIRFRPSDILKLLFALWFRVLNELCMSSECSRTMSSRWTRNLMHWGNPKCVCVCMFFFFYFWKKNMCTNWANDSTSSVSLETIKKKELLFIVFVTAFSSYMRKCLVLLWMKVCSS